jgi:DNA-directed RNA polymerase subunit RPC12/RpoP
LSQVSPSPLGEGRGEGGGSTFIKTFPCVSCGAKLSFAPGTSLLRCEYCAAENPIPASDDARVEELDLETWLKSLQGTAEYAEEEHVRCAKCGAEELLDGVHFATKCSFCGTALVSRSYAGRQVKPRALVPFQVDSRRAHEAFQRWLRSRWLAPMDLKRYARTDESLHGVYLPFWTYDCETVSDFSGARGTRRDKKTDWTPVSGVIRHFHDDVMVLASEGLPASVNGALQRWDTSALVPYKPEFIGGFHAQAYKLSLPQGFPVARGMIDAHIRELIRREIGGDSQRIDSVDTSYGRFTFKHVLMPAWISAYRYRDKVYRFVVNAQTGEASGEAPLSWWKIAGLVVLALVLLYFSEGG